MKLIIVARQTVERQDVVRSLELCPVFRPLERRSQSNAESEIQNIVKRTTDQRQLGETQKRFPIRRGRKRETY